VKTKNEKSKILIKESTQKKGEKKLKKKKKESSVFCNIFST
jgi:hypothetical protein